MVSKVKERKLHLSSITPQYDSWVSYESCRQQYLHMPFTCLSHALWRYASIEPLADHVVYVPKLKTAVSPSFDFIDDKDQVRGSVAPQLAPVGSFSYSDLGPVLL